MPSATIPRSLKPISVKPFRLALVLGLLAAISCGPSPAGEPTPSHEPSVEENPEITLSANRFAGHLLQISDKGTGDVVAAPASLYSLLAVLLNAAENDTLEAISKAMEMEEPRTDKLNPALRHLHDLTVQAEGYASDETIWFIWPILLDPQMPKKMEDSFGVSMTRVGTFRQDGVRRIEEYIRENAPYASSLVTVRLTKEDVYLAYSFVQADLVPDSGNAKAVQRGEVTGQLVPLGKNLEMLVLPLEGVETGPELFIGWESSTGKSDLPVPTVDITRRSSLKGSLQGLGLGDLLTGPVDMRYLSVELQGMYGLSDLEQVLDISIAGSEAKAQPLIWAVREVETGTVLLCGIQR